MTQIFPLEHRKVCTVKNALTWGICKSHLHQLKTQTEWKGRLVHFIFILLEISPIIGQIISLVEQWIVVLNQKPLPRSSIPQTARVRYQEGRDAPVRLWPKDGSFLGLTDAQRQETDQHIQAALRADSFGHDKKILTYQRHGVPHTATLPVKIAITKVNSHHAVYLYAQKVFAKGGERKVKCAYHLTSGTFFVKKRIVGPFEKRILELLFNSRVSRGLSLNVAWLQGTTKTNNPKISLLEPLCDGELTVLYGSQPFEEFSNKYQIILDLLEELNCLHSAIITKAEVNLLGQTLRLPNYKAFHGDLKPENVLVYQQNGQWRALLSDFGKSSSNPLSETLSIGYSSPERIRFYKSGFSSIDELQNLLNLCNFNINNGSKIDLWAGGLLILSILADRLERVSWRDVAKNLNYTNINFPPLPSLKARMPSSHLRGNVEGDFANLTQAEIDRDLVQLRAEVRKMHPQEQQQVDAAFRTVEGMLKVNPAERTDVGVLLRELKASQPA